MMYSSEHYDKFWSGIIKSMPQGGSYRFDQRNEGYNIIRDVIEPKSKVFDYACGLGIISIKLDNEKDCDVYGCDWSKVAVDYANENTEGKFKVTDEIFGDKYDYIIISHFLEHIENPADFVEQAFEHTKNVIVSLPNNFRHMGEHVNMQWSNWKEFETLFGKWDITRIDEGKYTGKTGTAWQHPIFIFKEKTMHPSYLDSSTGEKVEPKKVIKVKNEKIVVKKKGSKKVKTVTLDETSAILDKVV